jgi:hypothetical protein
MYVKETLSFVFRGSYNGVRCQPYAQLLVFERTPVDTMIPWQALAPVQGPESVSRLLLRTLRHALYR